ncbi:MAG: hypothetical protein R3B70_47815 [Polyangiaceae bacterium]
MTERLARRSRIVSSAAALTLLVAASALIGLAGCGSKMEEKECTKLKIEAFDLLNKAQHCNNDSDCNGSDWPDCQKPISAANTEEIQKKRDAYFTGQCEEQKPVCSDTTPVYCKQGLCVRKEKGAEGAP